MTKNYFYIILFILVGLFTNNSFSQNKETSSIEGLKIYPNPASTLSTHIYITSKKQHTLSVAIFDVLGKQILSTLITNNRLDITPLKPGIYILNITQNSNYETRKLAIR